jgi:hypothetical protein
MPAKIKIAALAVALLAGVGLTEPVEAGGGWHGGGGGIGPGAAVGLGLGAFALGATLANPYYRPYPYYGYAPAPAYPPYPWTPYYNPPRSCWNGYQYYPC